MRRVERDRPAAALRVRAQARRLAWPRGGAAYGPALTAAVGAAPYAAPPRGQAKRLACARTRSAAAGRSGRDWCMREPLRECNAHPCVFSAHFG